MYPGLKKDWTGESGGEGIDPGVGSPMPAPSLGGEPEINICVRLNMPICTTMEILICS